MTTREKCRCHLVAPSPAVLWDRRVHDPCYVVWDKLGHEALIRRRKLARNGRHNAKPQDGHLNPVHLCTLLFAMADEYVHVPRAACLDAQTNEPPCAGGVPGFRSWRCAARRGLALDSATPTARCSRASRACGSRNPCAARRRRSLSTSARPWTSRWSAPPWCRSLRPRPRSAPAAPSPAARRSKSSRKSSTTLVRAAIRPRVRAVGGTGATPKLKFESRT